LAAYSFDTGAAVPFNAFFSLMGMAISNPCIARCRISKQRPAGLNNVKRRACRRQPQGPLAATGRPPKSPTVMASAGSDEAGQAPRALT
jgi:hypothetical protein